MKALLLAFILGIVAPSWAQTTLTQPPYGAIAIQIPAASSTSSPSLTPLSLPFYPAPVFSGTIASVDAPNKLSTSAAWTNGQFTAAPTFFQSRAAASNGTTFLVTANSTAQITLDTGNLSFNSSGSSNASQIPASPGDKFELIPAFTLASFFGPTAPPLQTGASVETSDNVLLFDGTNWKIYFNDGTSWKSPSASGNQNNTLLPPEAAFFVRRRATSPTTLIVEGNIPLNPEQSILPSTASRFLAPRFPKDTTLAALGLHLAQNWKIGSSAQTADCVQLWNGTTWENYFYNGNSWRRSGSLGSFNDQPIPACSAFYIARKSSGLLTVNIPLPYSF